MTQAAGMNYVTTNQGGELWFHISQHIVLTLIDTRDRTLTQYLTLGIGKGDTSFTKQRLHNHQQEFNDSIALEKYNWSSYQAESIHTMRCNPKEAWKSVKIIYGGDTSHLKNTTIMRMRLPDGNTATTNADNASVLGPHFAKVFLANHPVKWSKLEEVIQRDVMQEFD